MSRRLNDAGLTFPVIVNGANVNEEKLPRYVRVGYLLFFQIQMHTHSTTLERKTCSSPIGHSIMTPIIFRYNFKLRYLPA